MLKILFVIILFDLALGGKPRFKACDSTMGYVDAFSLIGLEVKNGKYILEKTGRAGVEVMFGVNQEVKGAYIVLQAFTQGFSTPFPWPIMDMCGTEPGFCPFVVDDLFYYVDFLDLTLCPANGEGIMQIKVLDKDSNAVIACAELPITTAC
ncbi:uncharacterized protein LOC117168382 [Belonocnema kinseyi]|uniref:uncharacterized protein LOC117168382 n=1 Tax=Belonocnema kinseyi TaxID=2817044 RepID=UPI00143DFE7C|nr:uncharacterized protein LOC117168382 [Belonocnema kinseyi]